MAAGTAGTMVPLGGSIAPHDRAEQPIELHRSLVDNAVEQHTADVGPLIEQHGGSIDEPPQLVHHAGPDPDFWVDLGAERDVASLLGDIEKTLAQAHGLTGLTQVRNNYGFIGSGQTVAVIDSGIAFDHYALGGGLGGNFRVVGGWDFAENDANPYDDGPEGSHGTHVSGIVGADRVGTNDDGVAPGVDLVGLRVFDDVGNGYFHWVEYALQWVHQNRNAFENPITAVNLSIGSEWNDTTVPSWSTLEDEFAQLKADGIFISVSAGNSFTSYNTPGLSYPAASPHVVPVMSVDDSGSLSFFSQRHPSAIAAPGRFIVSTVPDYIGNHNGVTDDFASFSGTSMAAPYVAGASVILREAMQFLGYANITQTTLFDHLMATADTFFDAATNLNYKRLNLNSAINALMPADDYGSTAAAAHNLGVLSGSSEISGLVGTLSDADYFRFTAAANGTVSFTATTTHGLVPVWTGAGGVVSGNGQTFTFDVVAGQSYTFGISTGGGIGYFDLAIEATSGFTFTDWGQITQVQINNLANSGEKWYRVQASRNGYLTAEAFFPVVGGNIDISWHNSALQLLATGVANASGERVDVVAAAGSEYFLRVAGTNADVDFRLTNLVSQSGNVVNVAGTAGADVFSFAAGATHHVTVNGAAYSFVGTAQNTFQFSDDAGSDSITMTGTTGIESAILRPGDSMLSGSGFAATAIGVENVTVHGGGGSDTARLYDSTGDDTLNAWHNSVVLFRPDFSLTANGFGTVHAYASTGNDVARAFDTTGDDRYYSYPDRTVMTGTGYYNYAGGFDVTYSFATLGGNDTAYFFGSVGDDRLYAAADYARMIGAGFNNFAQGFEQTYSYSNQGGTDTAYMYGSAGDDRFYGASTYTRIVGTGFNHYGEGFELSYVYASQGGSDTAYFYGTTGDDRFYAAPTYSRIIGSGFNHYTEGFELSYGYFEQGGNDTAYFYGSAGDDRYYGAPTYARMIGNGFNNYGQGYDQAYVYGSQGGYDIAYLYGSAGDDVFYGWSNSARMLGPGFNHYVQEFDGTFALGHQGGNDTAYFYGSAGDDRFYSAPTYARMLGTGFNHYAEGFETGRAYAQQGDNDRAYIYDVAANDVLFGRNNYLSDTRTGRSNWAYDFDIITAFAKDGESPHADVTAVDYLFDQIGNWS
jgi:subtilisin family serine protease